MRIGHASIDERGKAKSGIAGDQTGKEVCIRNWYSKPWDYMLRCVDPNKAELMAQACEAGCGNNHIGYDQNQRNSLRTQAKLCGMKLDRIMVDCETDCSAFMAVCAECAGIDIPYNAGNAPTTSSMKNAFMKTGWFKLFTEPIYTTLDKYLKRGDILVKSGSHTVMVLDNGTKGESKNLPVLKKGSKGEYVKNLQILLNEQIGCNLIVDGDFGTNTKNAVISFQGLHGLDKDGIVGEKTWGKLIT